MALRVIISRFSDLRKRSGADEFAVAEPQEERKTMAITQPRPRRVKTLDAGPFAPEIGSFRLHLAAEGKAPKTVRTYVEAVAWFAAAHLIERTRCTRWDEVSCHDVQRWLIYLLTRYSDAYASNQFRALQQFFRWLADEEQLADPMAGLRAPKVREKLVPVFTSEELSALAKACQGRSFGQRRDAAIFAVLTATGIRAGELAGIRYDPLDPRRSDLDLWAREITVPGKGGKAQVVRIGHEAARALDRYMRVAARAVAGDEQPGADDSERDLPDDQPPGPAGRDRCVDAPVPVSLQPYLAGPRRQRRGPDGAEWLVLSADAAPLWR
jgi:site-specific recombinase XerC